MTDFKPKLGRLPQIPDRPALTLRAVAVALPVPPPETHNIECDAADTAMYGNDQYGDCVAVAIEKDRVIAAETLGATITKLTKAQIVANYFAMTGGSDDGLIEQLAFEWAKKHGWGGSDLLAFARVPITETALREASSEFQSCVFGLAIHASQMYPSAYWTYKSNDPYEGGHGTAGGTYWTVNDACKTWGYMATMTPSYISNLVDEVWVLVWDFQWKSLTYDRQVTLRNDYEALTGKAWTGPAPVAPPDPYIPRTSMSTVYITPVRALDTRIAKSPLFPGEDRVLQVGGLNGIPAEAVGVSGNLTFVNPKNQGWLALTPTKYVGPSSSANFVPNQPPDPNGFNSGLSPAGTVNIHNGSGGTVDVVLDVTSYDLP